MTTGPAPTEQMLLLRNLLANALGVTRAAMMQRIVVLPEQVLVQLLETVHLQEDTPERAAAMRQILLEAELELAKQRVATTFGANTAGPAADETEAADVAPDPPGAASENTVAPEPPPASDPLASPEAPPTADPTGE